MLLVHSQRTAPALRRCISAYIPACRLHATAQLLCMRRRRSGTEASCTVNEYSLQMYSQRKPAPEHYGYTPQVVSRDPCAQIEGPRYTRWQGRSLCRPVPTARCVHPRGVACLMLQPDCRGLYFRSQCDLRLLASRCRAPSPAGHRQSHWQGATPGTPSHC
jgi:hypothetical protein